MCVTKDIGARVLSILAKKRKNPNGTTQVSMRGKDMEHL